MSERPTLMSSKVAGSTRLINAPSRKRRIVVVTFVHLAKDASTQARLVNSCRTSVHTRWRQSSLVLPITSPIGIFNTSCS